MMNTNTTPTITGGRVELLPDEDYTKLILYSDRDVKYSNIKDELISVTNVVELDGYIKNVHDYNGHLVKCFIKESYNFSTNGYSMFSNIYKVDDNFCVYSFKTNYILNHLAPDIFAELSYPSYCYNFTRNYTENKNRLLTDIYKNEKFIKPGPIVIPYIFSKKHIGNNETTTLLLQKDMPMCVVTFKYQVRTHGIIL